LRAIDNEGNVVGHYRRRGIMRAFVRSPTAPSRTTGCDRPTPCAPWRFNGAAKLAGFFIRRNVPGGFVRATGGNGSFESRRAAKAGQWRLE
jgi:hypothetical protein